MLSKISAFFQALSEADNQQASELSLEIACSVLLCEVMLADGQLASIEEHIIRKIADLLHLRHSEYIQTKLNIQSKVSSVK